MPFVQEFDDVYGAITAAVEGALREQAGRCFRLDESRPAGRITDRLLRELNAAELCVADVTGAKPNVMWEIGYAMALGKPTILLAQQLSDLPFDLKDMQTLQYDRSRLRHTLTQPLHSVVIDTVRASKADGQGAMGHGRDSLIGDLLSEVQQLKSMVSESVRAWNAPKATISSPAETAALHSLEGAWVNQEGSHYYARIVEGRLFVPYAYQSDDRLTGVYYDWHRLGGHWFARFKWLPDGEPSGFVFLKQETLNTLLGTWWYNDEFAVVPDSPPEQSGVSMRWRRAGTQKFPRWALSFLNNIPEHILRPA